MIDLTILEFGKHRKAAARKGKQESRKRDSMKGPVRKPERMPKSTHADGAKA